MSAVLASIVAALLVGLAGGAHCALMCGGISSAMVAGRTGGQPVPVVLLAQLGRISSYMLAGIIVAAIGDQIIPRLAGANTGIVVGGLLGLAWVGIAFHLLGWHIGARPLAKISKVFWRLLQPLTRRVWPIDRPLRAFAAGALWGWLPCGMSYAMLAVAAATAAPLHAALLMLAFGVGTMPGTLLPALAASRLQRIASLSRYRPLVALLTLAMGAMIALAPWALQHRHAHSATRAQQAEAATDDHSHH